MKEEIEVLNGLSNKRKKYFARLEEFYNNESISLDEIINYEKSGLIINAKALNKFSVNLLDAGDRDNAIKLFQIATLFGSSRAKENYEAAILDNEKDLDPISAIEKLFQLAGQKIVPHAINRDLEDRPKSSKVWHTLSHKFDGFDPIEGDKGRSFLDLRLSQIRLDLATREFELFTQHLETATLDKEPELALKVLRLGKAEAEEKMQQTKTDCEIAKNACYEVLGTAKKKEYRRQVQTEKHFFSPRRTYDESTKRLALQLQKNRLTTDQTLVAPVTGTKVVGRRMITAELSTLQAVLSSYGRRRNYKNLPAWHMDATKTRADIRLSDTFQQHYGNTETIIFGEGQFHYYQRINPHGNHIGDFFLEGIESPERRYGHLLFLSGGKDKEPNVENEIKIAKWMIRYTSTGVVVTLEELQKMFEFATQKHLNKLIQIFYHCLIKEPMSWMMPAKESHELPYAIAQARAVKLVAKGYIHLKDVFDKDAPYNIFTGENAGENINVIRTKINRINNTYERCILTRNKKEYQTFFQFKREHSKGELVTSRKHLHEELVDAYGGGEDTDGEGYDSDTAESLYPTVFKF